MLCFDVNTLCLETRDAQTARFRRWDLCLNMYGQWPRFGLLSRNQKTFVEPKRTTINKLF